MLVPASCQFVNSSCRFANSVTGARGSALSRNKKSNLFDARGRMFLCPNGATSSSPGLARLGPTLGTRGDSQLPQRGSGKLWLRGWRPAVALGNHAAEHSTQRDAEGVFLAAALP